MGPGASHAAERSEPWQSNFGSAPPFYIGIEEELLLVDGDNRLADRGPKAVRDADPDEGDVEGELFTSMVESKSEPSPQAGEAIGAIAQIRRELVAAGNRLLGAGLHPEATFGEASIHSTPRYELISKALQGILRTPICGQHIHIGMPDPETAIRAYNGIRVHVPLINALAANSPFWDGKDSGLASARTAIFRSYPRAAMGPELRDIHEFETITRQICAVGGVSDYTHIWWDVRLHPMLGTIEVRAADTQFDIGRAAAIAALVHCVARIEAERDQSGLPAREALAESAFQATRHGLGARLMDRDGQVLGARELALRTLEEAAPAAAELGCELELAHVGQILEEGCGAEIQRREHATGGMDGLLAFLAAETARLDAAAQLE